MSYIDDLYSEHDPEKKAAKAAAQKTETLNKIANVIVDHTKNSIALVFDRHAFAGYLGYTYYHYDDPDISHGEEKLVFVTQEILDPRQSNHYVFYKFLESDYSLDDMNRIKSIVDGKLGELGLKHFTVRIDHGTEKRYNGKSLLGPNYVYFPAYLIWVECSW